MSTLSRIIADREIAAKKAELEAKREARRNEVEQKKQKEKEDRENERNAKCDTKSHENLAA